MPKTTKPKSGPSKSARRREELRRSLVKPSINIRALLERPELVNASLLLIGFILATSILVIWARDQIKVDRNQIMLDTYLKRVDYTVEDPVATEARQNEARDASPRVYRLNQQHLDETKHALDNLPKAVAGKTELNQISQELRNEYGLTAAGLTALQPYAEKEEIVGAWPTWVNILINRELRRNPLLESEEYQMYSKTLYRGLLTTDGQTLNELGEETRPIEITQDHAHIDQRVNELVRRAGFPPEVAPFVATRVAGLRKPTLLYDAQATEEEARRRAEAVEPVMVDHKKGEMLYRRGDRLTPGHVAELMIERREYHARAGVAELWLPRLGLIGLMAILTAFTGGFVLTSYPRVLRNPLRLTAIYVLMAGMLAVSLVLATHYPKLLYPAAIAPTLLVAIILLLSYDQRLALFLSTVQCAFVALALNQGVGWFVLLMAGCGVMIAQLREVRNRNSLIRASLTTAAVLGIATILFGLIISPMVEGIWLQIMVHAAWAVAASIVVGFLVLGILPSVERMFDITTGMTLAELRDPSQPLLRQLQQRAPGTYNHSLQVANIAEAAADAIGADSLLVYVGAMYHDIGKMNKPEYFVENQTDGYNKHSKLRPAMSLLVIVGHVKDGIELAREYGLPRSIQHFIESHHGTTLVEFFYHAAKTQAETDEKASVEEVEFRYPGPKPRTREAAILMLGDAVESATRAMAEPNPSRIESLVRELSRKRLLDGQFNDCDLTFRQLGLIEEAVIARLCAIHHGRISYPSTSKGEDVAPQEQAPAKPVTA